MFTNWLTGSSSSSNTSNISTVVNAGAIAGAGCGVVGGGVGGGLSTPPDVILEVGPGPGSVRFVAHALVLGMHSGYLRSAIRLDETNATTSTSSSSSTPSPSGINTNTTSSTGGGGGGGGGGEMILYLGNVTAEQFAPLLTYMYTGYLDLNVDNIFAVLLATHVLHMPRALEICRSFLARAQTEGYLSGNSLTSSASSLVVPSAVGGGAPKIIRPIPSKATMPNFGFLPLAPPPAPPSQPSAYHGLDMQAAAISGGDLMATSSTSPIDEEDIEVFIDSNTNTDIEDIEAEESGDIDMDMDCNVSVVSSLVSSSAASLNIDRLEPPAPAIPPTPPAPPAPPAIPFTEISKPTAVAAAAAAATATAAPLITNKTVVNQPKVIMPKTRSTRKSLTRKSQTSGGGGGGGLGLQVAKAPVPASQLIEPTTAATTTTITPAPTKFIIDVASCDGPVRFRRILNTAYGHKPEAHQDDSSIHNGGEQQRTQQSVSYSFHQQMAKAISSQQRQQQQQQQTATTTTTGCNQELYVCVYCKHTFKSQYCYQKHAKRHLNPLSLTPATTTTAAAAAATTAALLRREVRPLDMNVQYYPCKTCGSKFPSYYFVHKHRKLCHADEITENNNTNASSNNNNSNTNKNNNSISSGVTGGGGGPSSSSSSKRETTTTTTTTTTSNAADDNNPKIQSKP
ncbi:uncharacterized protein Dwil_GK25602 [Drosophila willistoni]|uniref:BTB domain-containing protein n=1 Tax=Drosophila willistoni TaxID=7260 RepID=B4NE91_DROWI|nr:uncharacterized protein Dwil_GK25602 [Drosophila willistoni]